MNAKEFINCLERVKDRGLALDKKIVKRTCRKGERCNKLKLGRILNNQTVTPQWRSICLLPYHREELYSIPNKKKMI